jgi:uncharacterized membrane protein
MINFLSGIVDWANAHPGQAIGAFAGFIVGLLILIFGLPKTLLVIILALIGFLIGKLRDNNVSFADGLKDIFKRKNE